MVSMTKRVLALAALTFVATSSASASVLSRSEQLSASWESQLDSESKERPVSRVIRLLKEMKDTLEKEKEADEEMRQKQECWCDTNKGETNKAIDEATAKITQLQADIEMRAARGAELGSNIRHLNKELASEKAGMAEAESIRAKEHGEFNIDELDMIESVTQLKNVIQILGKHHTGLIQGAQHPELSSSLATVLRSIADKYHSLIEVDRALKGDEYHTVFAHKAIVAAMQLPGGSLRKQGDAFMQEVRTGFLQDANPTTVMPLTFAKQVVSSFLEATSNQPFNAGSYSSRSGEIFGILKNMKDEFSRKLSDAQKEEMRMQKEFEELKADKTALMNKMQTQIDTKEGQKAENDKALEDAKEDIKLTRAGLSDDAKFLVDVRLTCQESDHEWEQRSKTRNDEITAVAEAMKVLSDDDSFDTFGRTLSFAQKSVSLSFAAARQQAMRKEAAEVVRATRVADASIWSAVGDVLGSSMHPDLSTLEVAVQLDAFGRVKQAIDDMVSELKKQQVEEVKKNDWCGEELNENARDTQSSTHTKKDLEHTVASLDAAIESLTNDVAELKSEVADLAVEMKKAGEQREKENVNFQATVADQRATKNILQKAMAKLAKFYSKPSMLQDKPRTTQPKMEAYKKNQGGNSVMSLLQMIIDETATLEAEAMKAEQVAQSAYETFVMASNETTEQKQRAVVAKTEESASKAGDREAAKSDVRSTEAELEQQANMNAQLHGECDYLMKNFDVRQAARGKEMEALAQTKSILAGAME